MIDGTKVMIYFETTKHLIKKNEKKDTYFHKQMPSKERKINQRISYIFVIDLKN